MSKRREIYPFMRPIFIGGSSGHARSPNIQPVLPIKLWGPDGKKLISVDAALVDTGADHCSFPSNLTRLIGYKIRSGEQKTFLGAASTGKAWEHYGDISILTNDYSSIFYKISKVPIHLVQKHKHFPLLLGRKGFLDKFIVHIDFPKKLFILEIP